LLLEAAWALAEWGTKSKLSTIVATTQTIHVRMAKTPSFSEMCGDAILLYNKLIVN
jgi:hypothetical protein